MDISFPDMVKPKVTAMGTVSFQTLVEGEYLWCEISCEALRDHFGAKSMEGHDLLLAFHTFKADIHQAARDFLRINGGRPVLLMSVNFQ